MSDSPPGRKKQGNIIPGSPFSVDDIHDVDVRTTASITSSVGVHSTSAPTLEAKLAHLEKQLAELSKQPTSEDVTRLAATVENATLTDDALLARINTSVRAAINENFSVPIQEVAVKAAHAAETAAATTAIKELDLDDQVDDKIRSLMIDMGADKFQDMLIAMCQKDEAVKSVYTGFQTKVLASSKEAIIENVSESAKAVDCGAVLASPNWSSHQVI